MLEQFTNEKYLNLETFKKDGTGVKTPLWFVVHEEALYMRTPLASWKVKRIRRYPRVRIVPSDARGEPKGPWLEGEAQVFSEQEMAWVDGLVVQKYGLLKRLIDLMNRVWGRSGQFAVIMVRVDSNQ